MSLEGEIYKKLAIARENSNGLFNKYEIENYNFDRRTLRIDLMGEYKRELILFTPRSMSISDIVVVQMYHIKKELNIRVYFIHTNILN